MLFSSVNTDKIGFVKSLTKISQQTGWQIVGKIVTSLSTIIVLGLVSRNYGESGTGLFTMTLTYLALFYLAVDFGFNAYVLPKFKDDPVQWQKLFGVRICWALLLLVLAILISYLLPFSNIQFRLAVLIGSAAILGNGLFISANAIFQYKLRYELSILASSFGALTGLLLIFILVSLKASEPLLLLAQTLSWSAGGLLALTLLKKLIKNIQPVFDFKYARALFLNSWSISATLVFNVIYFRLDSFILTAAHSFSEVGIYNLAYQLFQAALVLPTFVMNAYYPMMINAFSANRRLFKKELLQLLFIMLVLSLAGVVLSQLFAPIVISVITGGKGFLGAADSLRLLSFAFPAYFLSAVLMWVLVVMKKYKTMAAIYGAGLVVNALLNIIFIPQFSFYAASVITGISEYLILLLQAVIIYQNLK